MSDSAVVLFSGGQDSTTCLAWAIEQFGKEGIYTVSFDYGQKHGIELQCAHEIIREFDLPNQHKVLDAGFLQTLPTALTRSDIEPEAEASEESQNKFAAAHNLPSTFVPGRNMFFLTMAAAYAATLGITDLVTGVCEADDAGYPDCRASFILAAEDALAFALDENDFEIHTPLIKIDKAKTWQMAEDLGVLEVVRKMTHTCYNGVHDELHYHDWGFGCGECPSCKERAKGYYTFMGEEVPA